MNGETLILTLTSFLFVPFLYADSQYECGAHGRFEYCIDDIPGCVIGCHCHPGYYFDTDSKICEPNIKLSQDFRRQYLSEPTRIHVASITSPPEEQPTTLNAVDEKIEEISKDADDLGDWLYNQFFKTIENQVINKTQGEELPPTRRSGDVSLNKPSRRSHKYWKGRKKKKNKSKGLKSKLLRITEDDSLFDSESGSSSHEDNYSDSSSESDTSSSVDNKHEKKKKDDHGHKKIVIYNKKPQPPLPSFIFLPNMDTPYYPPIGLPPPPIPMYPMVPVPPMVPGPPMGGPLFPYPGVPPCLEDDVTSSVATTDSTTTVTTTTTTQEPILTTPAADPTTLTTTSTTITTSTTEAEPDVTTSITTEAPDTTTTEKEPLRHRHRKLKPIGRENNEKGVPINPLIRGNRNKQLWKKLRDKINRKNKLENFFVDQYQEPEAPMYGNDQSEFVQNRNFMRPNLNQMPPPPPGPDVDFKYLAELIHKADLNKTLNAVPNPNKPNQNMPENVPIAPQPSRRNDYPINNVNNMPNNVMRQRSRMEDPNDSFYTNLGKQIASMIGKIDLKGEREVNIEIEGANPKQQSQTSPIFNENNYASRSYWERSVRSPLKYLNSFKKEMDYLRKSNENLFSLENKVEIAASTARTLSLHDLENIISTVQKVKLKPKRNNIYPEKTDNSNASFKLNLLPGNIKTIQPIQKPKPLQSIRSKDSDIIHELNTRRQSDANSFLLSNFRQLSPDYDDPITNTATGKDSFRNIKPTRQPSADHKPNESALANHLITNMMPTFVKGTDKASLKYQLSPVLLNHRGINYHNKNQYQFGKALPMQYPGITKGSASYGKIEKPSYFHHEFHHFDYFDK